MKNDSLVIRIERDNVGLIFFNVLMAVFLISKMLRGLTVSTQVGGIWNYIQLIIILVGVVVVLSHINDFIKQPCCKMILAYSIIAVFNSLFNVSVISTQSVYSLGIIAYPGLLLCFFYYLCLKSDCRNNNVYIVIYYIIAVLFITYQIRNYRYNGHELMISNSYYVISLLPLVLCYTKKMKVIPFLVAFFCVVLSGKRAGLIAIVLAITGYFLIRALYKGSLYKYLRIICITIVSFIALYYVLVFLDETFSIGIIDRMLRIIDDGGSGRDVRWKNIIEAISHSSLPQLIMGHGNGTLSSTIGMAHNDFLQILYENGIVPLLFYILYYVSLFRTLVSMKRNEYRFTSEFSMSIIISLVLAMFSFYVIEGTYITCGMICQGFMLADYFKNESQYYDKRLV